MDCRLPRLDFDFAAAAGWYSSIAGLLAGFAFLAILLPLDHEKLSTQGAAADRSVVAFTCAFFSLVLVAFDYAVLGGAADPTGAGRAAHEQMLSGTAFGLATLLLLYGLYAVLKAQGSDGEVFEPALRIILLMTGVLGPLTFLALQFSNTLDLERLREAQENATAAVCDNWELPRGVWLNLAIIAIAAVAILVLALARRRLPRRPGASLLVSKTVLAFAVLNTVWASVFASILPDTVITSAWLEHSTLTASAAGMVLFSVMSFVSR